MRKYIYFILTVIFVAGLLFSSVVFADQQEVDNDIASGGNQNIVNITCAPGTTVNTAAQIILTKSGVNHLSPEDPLNFIVTPSQTTLPVGYSVPSVTGTTPSSWNADSNGTVYAVGWSNISFTAPVTLGTTSFVVKWEETHNYGNKLTGAPAFNINLTVEGVEASLVITKEVDVTETYEGESITYTYLVKNTGSVNLTAPVVMDSNPDVTIEPVLNGNSYNIGDDGDNNVFSEDEVWEFTAYYIVPWFTSGPVTNIANATAYYGSKEVFDESDESSVVILHNPTIDVTKSGPESGYFQSVNASYAYNITNTGDCSLNITLTDNQTGSPSPVDLDDDGYNNGDLNGNGYLDPDNPATVESDAETWYYTDNQLVECPTDNYTMSEFTNIATAEGKDATGTLTYDQACWTIVIFQWQPRTIGYWGNWINHYSSDAIEALLAQAQENSDNIAELTNGWDGDDLKEFLLGKPPKFKDDPESKAMFLMEKQFLATWLNVKAYLDWTGTESIAEFPESADVGMDPSAIVYTEYGQFTVMELLDGIETYKGSASAEELQILQEILDMMNNAENNGYHLFMDPDFDPTECE